MNRIDVEYHEEYTRNSRGVQLFTCRWLPFPSPKALVFLCHGYGMECSEFMKGVGSRLASYGYAVFGIDYEGHGKSMGARCYIKKFDNIVNDCSHFFKSICSREDYRGKKRFLYGESMGGAVALLVHKKDQAFWDGAVLVAPMCKVILSNFAGRIFDVLHGKMWIFGVYNLLTDPHGYNLFLGQLGPHWMETPEHHPSIIAPLALMLSHLCLFGHSQISEKVKPHPLVISMLTKVEDLIPRWKIVPTKDVIDSAFKDPLKREEIRGNKLIYQEKPRLKTALEMLRTSMTLEDTLHEVFNYSD